MIYCKHCRESVVYEFDTNMRTADHIDIRRQFSWLHKKDESPTCGDKIATPKEHSYCINCNEYILLILSCYNNPATRLYVPNAQWEHDNSAKNSKWCSSNDIYINKLGDMATPKVPTFKRITTEGLLKLFNG